MYYSSGNYEAFVRPQKPEGVERKSAYIVGTGLAALTAACYLLRDGQMPGKHIHIFEKDPIPGGACDGWEYPGLGLCDARRPGDGQPLRGDVGPVRSIPSIESPDLSVLDEYYYLNKRDPNYSLMRASVDRGRDAHTDGKFGLSDKGALEILRLFFTPDEALYDRPITDFFSDAVLNSYFWLYWRTMFAFENWHSALEMKLYLRRYIHHIGGLPDFRALRFTRYNQYESMILPMVQYLEKAGVQFHYRTKVVDVRFEIAGGKKTARQIRFSAADGEQTLDLTEDDRCSSPPAAAWRTLPSAPRTAPPPTAPTSRRGAAGIFGGASPRRTPPSAARTKFCSDAEKTNWMSATVTTLDDQIPPYIQRICQRDPFSGRVVTAASSRPRTPLAFELDLQPPAAVPHSRRGSWWGGFTACSATARAIS